jgi:peptidoglycan/LPS O-acetylase OafA/YrhL
MIGSLMMCVSVVILLLGMLAGIVMGIRQEFLLGPAHAHLNLVGGVLLFLFGLYYRLFPLVGRSPLARIQGWLHIIGGLLFPAGIALTLGISHALEPVPIVGALVVFTAMGLFCFIVLRAEAGRIRDPGWSHWQRNRGIVTEPIRHMAHPIDEPRP